MTSGVVKIGKDVFSTNFQNNEATLQLVEHSSGIAWVLSKNPALTRIFEDFHFMS